MCAHYETLYHPGKLSQHFGVDAPATLARGGEALLAQRGKATLARQDVWPGYPGIFIRRHPHADAGDEAVPAREPMLGAFGLIPHWAKDEKVTRHTYNARSETVAEKPSFRDAWRRAQHCIIPAEAIYEPDWRSGKAVPTRITLAGDEPMGLAGLWAQWRSPAGETVHSFTMLTINADAHPFMRQFHKPADEKRMVVILPPDRYDDWLMARAGDSGRFLLPWPADQLAAKSPAPAPTDAGAAPRTAPPKGRVKEPAQNSENSPQHSLGF